MLFELIISILYNLFFHCKGENVAEFFFRMSSITFEQAILKGLEEMEQRHGNSKQIGGGIKGDPSHNNYYI